MSFSRSARFCPPEKGQIKLLVWCIKTFSHSSGLCRKKMHVAENNGIMRIIPAIWNTKKKTIRNPQTQRLKAMATQHLYA